MYHSSIESELEILQILSDALTVPHTLDEGLQHITAMTCQLMGTGQTAILLRDEGRQELIVRTTSGVEGLEKRIGYPIILPDRLKSILWRLRAPHQINWVESGIEQIKFPILVTPINMRGERIGLLITGDSPEGKVGFSKLRRQVYSLIANFASLVIENAKVYDYLRQQFAQRSKELVEGNRKESGGRDETEQLMIDSMKNPDRVVGLLAETFYKELSRAGFKAGHITTAAARILDCIVKEEPY